MATYTPITPQASTVGFGVLSTTNQKPLLSSYDLYFS
jgi:hypothetical protein